MTGPSTDVFFEPPPKIHPGPDPLQKLISYRTHPFNWIDSCVMTLDQADKRNPIKKFPSHLPYVKPVLDTWLREPLVITRKSRRMVFSWLAIAYATWVASLFIGRNIFLVSDKEEKSDSLVQRARFIMENIPGGAMPIVPEFKYTYCHLEFPKMNSLIKGVPQGANQLRQETASLIVADEFAFWEQARSTYGAMRPTIEGGGQIIIISTSSPGFMRDLVEDRDE